MGKIFDSTTFRLFKEDGFGSSFNESVSSILSFSDSQDIYNYDINEKEADKNSLRDDWRQVGKDLRNSIEEYATSTK